MYFDNNLYRSLFITKVKGQTLNGKWSLELICTGFKNLGEKRKTQITDRTVLELCIGSLSLLTVLLEDSMYYNQATVQYW